MARKLEFDRDQAMDQALKLFWRRGYAATSLPELLATMGIARSSFYSSFGDKRSLFLECLERFGDRTLTILTDAADAQPPLAAIRHFFQSTTQATSAQRLAHGCLMVNSVLELAEVDPGLKAAAQGQLDRIQNTFELLLAEAIEAGELETSHTAGELAEVLMTLNLGIRVQSRKLENPETVARNINTSLALLGIAA